MVGQENPIATCCYVQNQRDIQGTSIIKKLKLPSFKILLICVVFVLVPKLFEPIDILCCSCIPMFCFAE